MHAQDAPSPASINPFPWDMLTYAIPALFERQVQRFPDRVAVQTRQQALSYTRLNQMANAITHAILRQRHGREEAVALLLDKDAVFLAAVLGVLKAGKLCVPLDPLAPPARLRFMLEDSQTALLLTTTRYHERATSLGVSQSLLLLDTLDMTQTLDNPALPLTPDTLATLLYTSGSTGQPKGVLQNHRNTVHNVMKYAHSLHVQADDRLSLITASNTIGSVRDTLSALLHGATIVPYNLPEEGFGPLAAWVQTERITILNLVATLFRHLMQTLTGTEQFSTVRMVKIGSEPLSPQDIVLFRQHFPASCRLYAGFATTETGNVTQYLFDHTTPVPDARVPLGCPLAGMEIRICDDTGTILGVKQVGEIVVRSRYLALGYWRRPELTQTVFLPDPEGGDARLYRTGDLGRLRPDGDLEHLGRRDSQVKIRGQRVELQEIELALLALPTIQHAAVVVREPSPSELRLVAYLAPTELPGPSSFELRQALQERLPAHMVPNVFIILPVLPRTTQGKVDRRALPEPDWQHPERTWAMVAPRTPVEEELARLWSEVLGVAQIGMHDTFFELGGHSLLATHLVSRISETFRLEVPQHILLKAATVAEMAVVVTQHLASAMERSQLEHLLQDVEKDVSRYEPRGHPVFPERLAPRERKL